MLLFAVSDCIMLLPDTTGDFWGDKKPDQGISKGWWVKEPDVLLWTKGGVAAQAILVEMLLL